MNGILPHALQKMSILYYLQSLCPVPAPMDDDAPTLIRLLAAPAAPASAPAAIFGLLVLTAFVLWIAGRRRPADADLLRRRNLSRSHSKNGPPHNQMPAEDGPGSDLLWSPGVLGALAVSPLREMTSPRRGQRDSIAILHSAHDRRAPATNLWQTGI